MSFMLYASNETGKSLAGLPPDGSGMLGQVMGHRASRPHPKPENPPASRPAALGHSDRIRTIRWQNQSECSGMGPGHASPMDCSCLAPLSKLSITGPAAGSPPTGTPVTARGLILCSSLVHPLCIWGCNVNAPVTVACWPSGRSGTSALASRSIPFQPFFCWQVTINTLVPGRGSPYRAW